MREVLKTRRRLAGPARGSDSRIDFHPQSLGQGASPPVWGHGRPVVVFDGVCGLCSGSVRWIAARDRRRVFRFTPAQGEIGAAVYRGLGMSEEVFDTFLLVVDGTVYARSDAALEIARRLPAPWRWLALARVVPRSWRDAIYDAVAKRRYQVFGRHAFCAVPDPSLTDRVL